MEQKPYNHAEYMRAYRKGKKRRTQVLSEYEMEQRNKRIAYAETEPENYTDRKLKRALKVS